MHCHVHCIIKLFTILQQRSLELYGRYTCIQVMSTILYIKKYIQVLFFFLIKNNKLYGNNLCIFFERVVMKLGVGIIQFSHIELLI